MGSDPPDPMGGLTPLELVGGASSPAALGGYARVMVGTTCFRGAIASLLVCLHVLGLAGCAGLGDGWREAATAEQRQRAETAFARARAARAAGDARGAATELRAAADLGHPGAAYELGLAYAAGDGVPKDLDASAHWINRAADLGDPGAQFLVGSSLYGGIGVARDAARGLAFLEQAAEQGHPRAQLLLGQAYADGSHVTENPEWAARWYGKAARGGNAQAQYALGVMYATGFGLPASPRRAYQWFAIAAANGYAAAGALRDEMRGRLAPDAVATAEATIARFSPRATSGFADAPTVLYVQLRLRALGFDAGPADGIAGPRTRAAIEAFQSARGLSVDGKLSRALVEDLFARRNGDDA